MFSSITIAAAKFSWLVLFCNSFFLCLLVFLYSSLLFILLNMVIAISSMSIKVPRLLAIAINLIELSNCCICLHMTFRFTSVDDDNGKPISYKFSFFNYKQFCLFNITYFISNYKISIE
jgi:hypothetical protein